jgi:predicted lipase
MSNGKYDPVMSLVLAEAVEQAYQYYVNGPSYKINLPGYAVQSILSVWETDEYVPIGFTAVGIQPGIVSRNLVIFRGTQTDEESIEDMCWDGTPCILTNVACGTAATGIYSFYADDDGGIVTSLETCVQNAVASLVSMKGASKVWYFAGHSLGGALATLACLDAVAGNWLATQTDPLVTLYTYGSLHVGQADFASAFNAAINPTPNSNNAFRVANLADWVPSFLGGFIDLPDCQSGTPGEDTPGYVHVGQLCSYLWQTDGDWSNHALDNTYLKTLANYPQVVKVGPRSYPE